MAASMSQPGIPFYSPTGEAPTSHLRLTPRAFLELWNTNKSAIRSTVVIPPTLGKPGYGEILVELFAFTAHHDSSSTP